ncbi:MAG: DUF547 domain-containing protein [Cryomorphaceae bacterium]|nr:DUF547 domain-containing protein [Flavobacteriales bacterium]
MNRLLILFFISFCSVGCTDASGVISTSEPVSHAIWDGLLKKHVNEKGMVNYKGFISDSLELNKYLAILESNHPNKANWGKDQQLAYWINAYNAFTIRLIIRNYPVESIKDIAGGIPFINTPWDVKFINIENENYDLNNIEHGIIRKDFNEPRIHFALVCAAVSCPRLRREAYTAAQLDSQLNEEAVYFFNNPEKNKVSAKSADLSKLMKWYRGDFKDAAPDIVTYVNRYSKTKMDSDADINYLDYSWELNEQ